MEFRNYMRHLIYRFTVSPNLRSFAEFLARTVPRDTRGKRTFSSTDVRWGNHSCASRERQVYLVLSFILLQASLQGDSRSRHRRCSSSGRRTGRFAVTRVTQSPTDWPCANLTYNSRTLTTLFFSRRTLPERTRGDEIHEMKERPDGKASMLRNAYVEATRVSVSVSVSLYVRRDTFR